jgi:hypothetical protein
MVVDTFNIEDTSVEHNFEVVNVINAPINGVTTEVYVLGVMNTVSETVETETVEAEPVSTEEVEVNGNENNETVARAVDEVAW